MADATVAALAAGGVETGDIPPNATYPLILVFRIDAPRDDTIDGPLGRVTARMQLEIRGNTKPDVFNLAQAVRRRLNGLSGTFTYGADTLQILYAKIDTDQGPFPGQDRGIYRIIQDYMITYQED